MSESIENDYKGRSKEFILEDENGGTIKVLELDGMVFPMPYFDSEEAVLKRLATVKNIQYERGDVMICSFPKTGSHWTDNLVHFLLHDGPLDELSSHSPWLIDYFDVDDNTKRDNERILTTHYTLKRLPTDHFANGGKTILVYRNPKDSAVSMYHMMRRQNIVGDFNLSWDKFLSYWIDGKIIFGSYFDFYNQWQEDIQKNPHLDILIVQYEELKRNCLHEVRRIQKYLDLNHSDERLEAVINRCSLSNLRQDVDTGKVKTDLIDDKGNSVLYRKGIVGDWKNHFTVAQNEQFETIVQAKMKDSIFNYKAWD